MYFTFKLCILWIINNLFIRIIYIIWESRMHFLARDTRICIIFNHLYAYIIPIIVLAFVATYIIGAVKTTI